LVGLTWLFVPPNYSELTRYLLFASWTAVAVAAAVGLLRLPPRFNRDTLLATLAAFATWSAAYCLLVPETFRFKAARWAEHGMIADDFGAAVAADWQLASLPAGLTACCAALALARARPRRGGEAAAGIIAGLLALSAWMVHVA
jgi:hypothetical protein